MRQLKFLIANANDGILLREYLRNKVEISHNLLVRLKQTPDGIRVNGHHATVRTVLHEGDCVELTMPEDDRMDHIVPRALPLTILYEDESVLVVNKKGGMPTHPSYRHYEDTLANAVANLYAERGQPFVFRPVNRLDAGTSGIVLLAKDQHVAHLLAVQMAEHSLQKEYIAVVSGAFSGEGTLTTGFRRKEGSVLAREVFSTPACDAERASTSYRTLDCGHRASLLSLVPHTGRTHQLRVHCAYLGHPILGDWLYGCEQTTIPRPMLHSASMTFTLPTGKQMRICAPLPEDFCTLCHTLALGLPQSF